MLDQNTIMWEVKERNFVVFGVCVVTTSDRETKRLRAMLILYLCQEFQLILMLSTPYFFLF